MSVLGDKLSQKLAERAKDVNAFIWKGPKENGIQKEYKLIDASFDELQKYYEHCQQMLYNKDPKNPGRLTLLHIVQDQILRCRAELLIRWLKSEKQYTPHNCLEDLRTIIANNKETLTHEALKTYPIDNLMDGLPLEFTRIPVSLVMDACLDFLGLYKNEHLTLSFVVKMGLWFTGQEMQRSPEDGGVYVKDPETGKAVDRLSVVAKELRLDPGITLRVCDTGLSFGEFKTMYKLRPDKYSNLTTAQLKLLSNKVLYRFQLQCEKQAKQWSDRIAEINIVAKSKGWDVTRSIK